jgi:protein-S-isoprenylcysteine O-methyltransferase Ste14
MNTDAAHKSNWEIAEVVFGIPFLISLVFKFIVPFQMQLGIPAWILFSLGITLVIIGTGIITAARRELARYGQPTDPGLPTTQVAKTGIFARSRNPLYLGAVFIITGIALTMNTLWILIALLISITACHYILILPEERYLMTKFGSEYESYKATVRRWLGRK